MSKAKQWYVGIDAHKGSSSVCVMDVTGRVFLEQTCSSQPAHLISLLENLAGEKDVVIEETTIADFLYRCLRPYARSVVVASPRHNALLAEDDNISDQISAQKLATLLRMNCIKPVYHPLSELRHEFKSLVLFRDGQNCSLVRFRNKFKAIFGSYLIPCEGSAVYGQQQRQQWLDKLPYRSARFRVQELYEQIDDALASVDRTDKEIAHQARRFPEIELFKQLPGIGPVRAATWFAIIDTPDRFERRSHLWAYCGLGIVRRKSANEAGPQHLNRNGNPMLKNVLKSAAVQAIGKGDHNRFQRQFERLLSDHVPEAKARLTVARSIATTMHTMWRTGEDYQDDYKPRCLR